ncbi:hypothetical protein [Streptomyces sp. WM6386]|uniref:hypothetical protein n=1 Tax=Streptomyces sp. WM6386 TaxID=1415558 RepID=UPI000619CE41|nr:hypothetical protein [Streptomyces sp. WM6386]KKD07500.1 hypothetical protein TN53_13530 [Streptomyces sp. WM6386]
MRPSGRSDPPPPADDRHWRGTVRLAAGLALTFGALTLFVDWDMGTLTLTRALLWLTLSATVFAVLFPQRVTAGPGWLEVQGLAGHHRVHTDALVSVQLYGQISSHLILRDTHGNRLECDPRVLITNPFLWHELDTGVRHSLEHGTLRQSPDALRHLGQEIDDEAALSVLRASGIS